MAKIKWVDCDRAAKPRATRTAGALKRTGGLGGVLSPPVGSRGGAPENLAFWAFLEPLEGLKSTKFYRNLLEKMPKNIQISISFFDKDSIDDE